MDLSKTDPTHLYNSMMELKAKTGWPITKCADAISKHGILFIDFVGTFNFPSVDTKNGNGSTY